MDYNNHEEVETWLLDNGFTLYDFNQTSKVYDKTLSDISFKILYSNNIEYCIYSWVAHKKNIDPDKRYTVEKIDIILDISKLYFKDIVRNDIIDDLLSPN